MREKHACRPIRLGRGVSQILPREFQRQDKRCMSCGKSFKINAVQQLRFQKLALNERAGYANDGIIREHHRAFTYGVDLDSKLERAQILKKIRIE